MSISHHIGRPILKHQSNDAAREFSAAFESEVSHGRTFSVILRELYRDARYAEQQQLMATVKAK